MYKKENNKYIKYSDYYKLLIQYKDIWYTFYIDLEEYNYVKLRHWRVSHKKNKVYAISGSKTLKNVIYLHCYIWRKQVKDGHEIDHIDCNSFNNRKENLREVTRLQNIQNVSCRIDNEIGVRGISYSKQNKNYTVDFSFNKKRYYFQKWHTISEAVYCRKFAEEYFNLEMLNRNPLVKQYLNFSKAEQEKIKNYVYTEISRNGRY